MNCDKWNEWWWMRKMNYDWEINNDDEWSEWWWMMKERNDEWKDRLYMYIMNNDERCWM